MADVNIAAVKKGQAFDFQAFRVTLDSETAALLPRLVDGGKEPYAGLSLDLSQEDAHDNTAAGRIEATLCSLAQIEHTELIRAALIPAGERQPLVGDANRPHGEAAPHGHGVMPPPKAALAIQCAGRVAEARHRRLPRRLELVPAA